MEARASDGRATHARDAGHGTPQTRGRPPRRGTCAARGPRDRARGVCRILSILSIFGVLRDFFRFPGPEAPGALVLPPPARSPGATGRAHRPGPITPLSRPLGPAVSCLPRRAADAPGDSAS
ncbi:hypothetical protein OHJ16_02100 [Actinomyces israelii]|uniref:Uncharacterized protein n=1 Tax=Actinomyces israelii TaxID=1659 RepID=A0ABT4I5Q8_9ACTO|nr:hypothetical protein [Actinomyces israelii]MCZ0856846.1 hypothetical protein [Actinomyces israelii]WKR21053.1 hypothetical protein AIF0345_0948 [Actinomyces israelii]